MANRHVQIAVGLVLVAFGIYLALSPERAIEWFGGKLPKTSSDVINLRASYGGTSIGIGAFVAWLPALKPWLRSVLGLLGWAMAGIGAARLTGFALDGNPDGRQAIWIIAEVILAAGSAYGIRRLARRAS
jgi:uncharacterized protein YjeT (DUF2065 family)